MPEILYKELSYNVVGALFDAFESLGSNYQEKYCQRAVEKFLKFAKFAERFVILASEEKLYEYRH